MKCMVCLPFFLGNARVDSDGWEVALSQELVELGGSESALDEDDNLIEFESIEQVVQLPILLAFTKFEIILLKTVQSELGFVVHVDLHGVSHELFANWTDFL